MTGRAVVAAIGVLAGLTGSPAAQAAPFGARDPEAVYTFDWVFDGAVIAGTGLGILIPYAFATDVIHPSCPCAASSVNSFDRGVIGNHSDAADWVSNITVGLIVGGLPAADWLVLRRADPWLSDAVVFGEALSVNGALVTLAKYVVQRPIPRVYSDPGLANDRGSYRSFYSGHTSLAMAALSTASVTVDLRYGWTWQPWAVTAVVGGSIAAERVAAGMHFYTYVMVGAAAGALVGTLIGVTHLRRIPLHVAAFRPDLGEGAGLSIAGTL